jgi:AraC family transcriptional regulator, transcriptional activator of pobA
MKNIVLHHNISDLYKSLNIPLEQDIDFAIHFLPAIHKTIPFKSPVFRTEYFSFVFVKEGRGNYTTDAHIFKTEPRTIYFTNPGHIKAFEMEELSNAYIITLTESFLRENVHADIFNEFPFLLAEIVPPKILSEQDFAEFEALYLQIFDEFNKKSTYRNKILGNLFVVLLLKIKEKFWLTYNPMTEGYGGSQIVSSFKKLLEQHFVELATGKKEILYQVQDYAAQLNLHPNYLSNVIKSKTGKTVNSWITERTLSTAKSLLKNTPLSSKEISTRLGFSEATHFARFFKKNAGITPNAFRKDPS